MRLPVESAPNARGLPLIPSFDILYTREQQDIDCQTKSIATHKKRMVSRLTTSCQLVGIRSITTIAVSRKAHHRSPRLS